MTSRLHTKNLHQVTILLVDDQPTVRYGLRMVLQLEPGAIVIGEAGNADEALVLTARLRPDIVIMDVQMPGINGMRPRSA